MSIKVMIVDDSAFMRKILSDILSEDPLIEVIDTARNGKEALEKLESISPDIITLDVEMPIMDGISTLEKIVNKNYKIPVIMVSSITTEGADLTLKALDLGAVDFITKPTSIFKLDSLDKKIEIINKIKVASKVKITSNTFLSTNTVKYKASSTNTFENKKYHNVIGIGTSTGGPKALQAIIPNIPADINGSICIVQHMPPGFTKSLANRLNTMSNIEVKEAENDEIIKRGYCYIAPGDKHMLIENLSNEKLKIRLTNSEPVSGHKPSVDVLMESISEIRGYNTIGVILTGMGSDGAKGIYNIKQNSGYTIAQDEESSVVFGMPKSAIKKNCIDKILSLDKIASDLINKVGV